MKRALYFALLPALALLCAASALAQTTADPFIGRWALDLPNKGAGWLGIDKDKGYLDGAVLWQGGSVVPVDAVYMDGNTLCAVRLNNVERKDTAGKVVAKQAFPEILACTVNGDELKGVRTNPKADGTGVDKLEFTGKRIPPLPPAPDLSKVKFGKPIKLFNGKNLDGWKLFGGVKNGWSVSKGVLTNDPKQEEGKPHLSYGNIRSEKEFEDFNLTFDVNMTKDGNSGVYLRGIYEVQMLDSFGKPIDTHNMCSIYSRLVPLVSAEKPAGEWQTVEITLVDRHVTVKLNGKLVQDNAALLGCTGGALWSDEFRPGPIYLQGDHSGVSYRNMVLRPVVK
jgi:hypothetical protein